MTSRAPTLRISSLWNIDDSFATLILAVTLTSIFVAMVFPAGSIYGINVKIVLSATSILCGSFFFLRNPLSIYHVVIPLIFSAFLLFYGSIALLNGVGIEHIGSQSIAFLSLFAVTCLPIYFVQIGVIRAETLLKTTLVSAAAVSTLKVILWYFLLNGIPLVAIKSVIEQIFGVSFIGLEIDGIYRINWPIDYILPILIFVAINDRRFGLYIGKRVKIIFLILAFFSLYSSYSRYLWVYGFIAAFFSLTLDQNTSLKSRFGSILAFSLIFLMVFFQYSDVIIERFSGNFAASSDNTRTLMLPALIDSFVENPLFGHGLGSTTKSFVNIEDVPWYFELQWLAFAMQFGITGLLLLIYSALRLVIGALLPMNTSIKFGVLLLYILWLSVGLVNGFMLTSSGASIFLVFYLASFQSSQVDS